MRHPVRQAGLYLALNVLGVRLVALVFSHPEVLGKTGSTIAGVAGLFLAIISFFLATWSLLAAIGYLRLRAGKTSVARSKVSGGMGAFPGPRRRSCRAGSCFG